MAFLPERSMSLRPSAEVFLLYLDALPTQAGEPGIVEKMLSQLAKQEQKIRDAAEKADRLEAEGAGINEVLKIIPAAHASYRGAEIAKFSDIDPGYAEAALKILVR